MVISKPIKYYSKKYGVFKEDEFIGSVKKKHKVQGKRYQFQKSTSRYGKGKGEIKELVREEDKTVNLEEKSLQNNLDSEINNKIETKECKEDLKEVHKVIVEDTKKPKRKVKHLFTKIFLCSAIGLVGVGYIQTNAKEKELERYQEEVHAKEKDYLEILMMFEEDTEFINVKKYDMKDFEKVISKNKDINTSKKVVYKIDKLEERVSDYKKIQTLYTDKVIITSNSKENKYTKNIKEDITLENIASIDKKINYTKENSNYNKIMGNYIEELTNYVNLKVKKEEFLNKKLSVKDINKEELGKLIDDLNKVGIDTKDLTELYNKKEDYDFEKNKVSEAIVTEVSNILKNESNNEIQTNELVNTVEDVEIKEETPSEIKVEPVETTYNVQSTGTNIGGIEAQFMYTNATGGFDSQNIVYQWGGLPNYYLTDFLSPVGQATLGLREGSTFMLNGVQRTVFHVEYGFVNDEYAQDRITDKMNSYGGSVLQVCETINAYSSLRMVFFN